MIESIGNVNLRGSANGVFLVWLVSLLQSPLSWFYFGEKESS